MLLRDTLRALTPVVGQKKVAAWWHAYLTLPTDKRRDFEAAIQAYAAQRLDDDPSGPVAGLFPPPPPERCLGTFDLGKTLYAGKDGYLFGLRLSELTRHVGLYGSSGCGKTNALALIVDGLVNHRVPFLLLDFKRSFRGLLRDHSDLLVFTAGDARTAPFQWNPLIPPPGTDPENWSRRLIGAISHAYCQGAGSESLLRTAIMEAYDAAARKGKWPTFADVSALLDAMPAKGRKGMWLDSARRAITSLSTGSAADTFCPTQSLDLAKLLAMPVVVELELLSQAEQTLLSEAILLWTIAYRLHRPQDRDGLRHAIIIEEAHHLLRAPPGVGDGTEPVIHIALREIRELGESVILATQNASIVPLSVFGNQATTLAFHTKHASDVRAVSQAMLLQDEARDQLGRLPVGEAVVRVPRWPEPVHIRLSHRPLGAGYVADTDIRESMRFRLDSADSSLFHARLTPAALNQGVPPPDREPGNSVESPQPPLHPKTTIECPPPSTPDIDTPAHVPAPDVFPTDGLPIGEAPRPAGPPSPVRLPASLLLLGVLAMGMIGAGKSTFVRRILAQLSLMFSHVRLLVLDPNSTYASLVDTQPGRWLRIPWETVRLNPLCAAKGIPYVRWIPRAIDILSGAELMHSRYLLIRRVERLFERAGVPAIDDGASPVPSLFDLRQDLETRRERPGSREEGYRAAALTVLDGRVRSTGDLFRAGRGMEHLLTTSRVILDVRGLAPLESQIYLTTHLCNYLCETRASAPAVDPPELAAWVVLEEAQTLMQRGDPHRIPFWRELLTRSRSCGVGYCLVGHHISGIDPLIASVMGTTAVFSQTSDKNKRAAADILDLSPRERELLSRLAVGSCLFRMAGHAPFPHPFLLNVAP